MPQLRITRADTPTHPAEQTHVVFSSAEAAAGGLAHWLIGRGPDYRMCIADGSVSRPHLQVLFQGGAFHLRNLSKHGCEIGGRPVALSDPPVTVTGNLSVKLGDIQLRCTLLPDAEPGPVAPAPSFDATPAQRSTAELPAADWWTDPAHSVTPASVDFGADPFAASDVPAVDDWCVDASGAARQGMDVGVDPFAFDGGFAGSFDAGAPHGDAFGAGSFEGGVFASTFGQGNDGWAMPLAVEPAPVPDVAMFAAPLAAENAFVSPQGIPTPIPSTMPASQAGPVTGGASVDDVAVVARILQAAGLRTDVAALHAKECSPERVGELLSQLLAGLVATLATRRSIKNTLRVAHTEVKIDGNNPLKHAVTPVEALFGLVQGDRAGYLPVDRAIHEVFRDLADHELALVEGVEAALKHVVGLVSPEAIEQAVAQSAPKSTLGWLGRGESQFWRMYRTRFADFLGNGRAFSGHFLPAFRDAYDACLAKLRRQGGTGSSKK